MADKKKTDAVEQTQKTMDEATDQGFIGEKADPRDNSEYSLESGPDSPSAAEQNVDAARARVEQAEADLKDKQ